MGMPAAQYAYDSFLLKGAPPETKNLIAPPTPSRHFEKTRRLATAYFAARIGDTGSCLSFAAQYS